MKKNKINKLSYLGYVWTFLVNVFTVFVVLAIFDSVYKDFETIILCITILVYLNVNSFSSLWAWLKQRELFELHDEFEKIRKLLDEKVDESDEEYKKEEIENSKNRFEKQQVKFYINSGFALIIYIITLLTLFSAL
ncbi:hypothetical protein ACFLZP_02445 [Patescibacteria group bacterium]